MSEPAPEPLGLPFTVETRDASITERWDVPTRIYRRFDNGQLTIEREFSDAEDAWAAAMAADTARRATQAALLQRARSDLTENQAFLDAVTAGTATAEDAIAQVAQLTRQAQGFIRLTVGGELLEEAA
ncbi:hypothetical protein [Actinacidiphila glaucinigra]|uniref:hypothetical protein n=1 Tax=Actinacidiphila glaucinigra TaxID=235986 RepID=UPI0035D70E52